MGWKVHRPADGRLIRGLVFALIAAWGVFTAYKWYMLAIDWRVLLPQVGQHPLSWGEVGAIVSFALVGFFGYFISYVKTGSANFLIEVEAELRKVTWPEWKPLFRPSTEVWGHTYAVIIFVAIVAAMVSAMDMVFQFLAKMVFYQ